MEVFCRIGCSVFFSLSGVFGLLFIIDCWKAIIRYLIESEDNTETITDYINWATPVYAVFCFLCCAIGNAIYYHDC